MQRPKLKDKVYGEMFWEDWEEDDMFWYAPMKTDAGERFDLSICADSQANFLAVVGTHSTYRRIMENLDSILTEMLAEILKNSRLLKKKRERKSAGETIKKELRLFSVKIFQDLSSTVEFVEKVGDDEDPDEKFYALIDEKGGMLRAGVEEL